jgi:hypothetical protein
MLCSDNKTWVQEDVSYHLVFHGLDVLGILIDMATYPMMGGFIGILENYSTV